MLKKASIKKGDKIKSLIEINTVDKFQGAERDIIIYDIVRSDKGKSIIGFLQDYRRINVAFSRAKRLLIIVGDSEYILKRAMLFKSEKFTDFKLQNIVKELKEQVRNYNGNFVFLWHNSFVWNEYSILLDELYRP